MILAIFAVLLVIFVILPLVGAALWMLVSVAVSGIVFGALGRLVLPGAQPIGILATVLCGWIGSLIGLGLGHVIGLGWFGTTLIEIALSAGAVAIWSGTHRRPVTAGRRHGVIDV